MHKNMTVNIPANYVEVLDKIAAARGISNIEVIRQAIGLENLFFDEVLQGNKLLIRDGKTGKYQQVSRA